MMTWPHVFIREYTNNFFSDLQFRETTRVTYDARLLPCSAVLNSLMGLKRAKRSGIQAQITLIPVDVTTLEVKLLKSTVSTDCL